MARLARLSKTSIGKKLLMALSGLVLLTFVVGHMLGNMMIFQGPEALNAYAHWLQGHPLLWLIRLAMLLVLVLHVALGVQLARENRGARPQPYAHPGSIQMTFVERHILLTGLLVFAFLIYHISHLTVGLIDPGGVVARLDSHGRPDVYMRVVTGFRHWWVSLSYLVAIGILGLHLQHGIRSLFQTLGLSHESYQSGVEAFAKVVPGLLVIGFASIPVLVLLGVVALPQGAGS